MISFLEGGGLELYYIMDTKVLLKLHVMSKFPLPENGCKLINLKAIC